MLDIREHHNGSSSYQKTTDRRQCLITSLMLAAFAVAGCNGSGNSVSISGEVRLDGTGTPAEIQIEQLDGEGHRVGRSVTAYADPRGEFSASIETSNSDAGPITCGVVVRVSELTSSGLSATFDENSPREKVTRLRRVLRNNDRLKLLLTR
ncbi:MAG: hypothetical protein HQ518_21520 [Rhodopirellula sp.]|nr:hypothetical protein [Rhodopirellula sp.]